MSNIRTRIEFVKEAIDRLTTEKLDYSEAKNLIDRARTEMRLIEYPLKHGDIDYPICCYSSSKEHGKEQLGCKILVGKDGGEWVWNFYGNPDEFIKYCKTCRNEIKNNLPILRKKLDMIIEAYREPPKQTE